MLRPPPRADSRDGGFFIKISYQINTNLTYFKIFVLSLLLIPAGQRNAIKTSCFATSTTIHIQKSTLC